MCPLAPELFDLLSNREYFILKTQLQTEVIQKLDECRVRIEECLRNSDLPGEVLAVPPKISRGENYLGFPWQVLDFPRQFNKDAVFAMRTLCWWGNDLSLTLHLSGRYLNRYEASLFNRLQVLAGKGYMLCIHQDPWQHHHESDNYSPLEELLIDIDQFRKITREKGFLKLSKTIPFTQWDQLPQEAKTFTDSWIELLQISKG